MTAEELKNKLIEANNGTIRAFLNVGEELEKMTEEERRKFHEIAWREVDTAAFNGAWALDFLADNTGKRKSWRSKFRKLLGYGG